MVLGTSSAEEFYSLGKRRARVGCACSRCGRGCLDYFFSGLFFSHLSFLFSPPLSGRRLCRTTFSTKIVRSYFAETGRGLKVRMRLNINR